MTQWGYGGGPTPPGGGDPFGGGPFGGIPFGGPPQFDPPRFSAPPPAQHREVNTLATLSIVFAPFFAPAGAVLGHLGLRQVQQTGQPGRRRAIVGLALSYSMIVVLVVSLSVWLASHDTSTAAGNASNGKAAAAPACGQGIPAPPVEQGRTVSDDDLSTLALPLSTIQPSIDAQLTIDSPLHELLTAPYPFGTTAPTGCAQMLFAGTADAYHDTGYRAAHVSIMSGSSRDNPAFVIQAFTSYADAESAHQALDNIVHRMYVTEMKSQGDPGMRIKYTSPTGVTKIFPRDPGAIGSMFPRWVDTVIQSEDKSYWVERVLFQRGNVIVDFSSMTDEDPTSTITWWKMIEEKLQ